jgi:hypothetical protein
MIIFWSIAFQREVGIHQVNGSQVSAVAWRTFTAVLHVKLQ